MQELVLFFLTFLFIFLIYQLFVVRRAKKQSKKNKKELVEVLYLVKVYHLDMKKIHYPQLLQIVAITSSLDIAFVVTIIMILPNFFLELIIGFCSLFVIILVSYHMVYLFYKKKGMIRDEF